MDSALIGSIASVDGTVMRLASDDEPVRCEQFGGLRVAVDRGRVVQIDVVAEVVKAPAAAAPHHAW